MNDFKRACEKLISKLIKNKINFIEFKTELIKLIETLECIIPGIIEADPSKPKIEKDDIKPYVSPSYTHNKVPKASSISTSSTRRWFSRKSNLDNASKFNK